jgi:hypothetical protein
VQQERKYGVLLLLRKRANRLQQQWDSPFQVTVLIRYLSDIAHDTGPETVFWRGLVDARIVREPGANRLKV